MRLDRLQRLVTAATVLAGLAVLALSGDVPWIWIGICASAVGTGTAFPRICRIRHLNRIGTGVMVTGGLVLIADAIQGGNYVIDAISFAILLSAVKALLLRRFADFLQILALSFLHVVAGAVVNPGLSFGVLMLPYVTGLTLALMLNHVRQGIETRAGPATDAADAFLERRDLVRPAFLAVTALVTLAVFVLSLVFFTFFPRMGFGFFATQSRRGLSVTGFSEEVTLGDFGTQVEDPEVILRVKPRSGAPEVPLRMRGQSLDTLEGATWRKTARTGIDLPRDPNGRFRLDLNTTPLRASASVVQDVYLEPLRGTSGKVVFSPPQTVALEFPGASFEQFKPGKWRVHRDPAGDVTILGHEDASVLYSVYIDPKPPDPDAARAAGTVYPVGVREVYLRVPALDPAVPRLAAEVTAGKETTWDKAVAVESFFHDRFTYSLGSEHGSTNPIADFLLVNRTGHCEYFASGMVILLRLEGVPSRIVNGFYGGKINEFGNYVSMRQADAHSWVEVYFPGQGWIAFDPTPAGALSLRPERSLWTGISEAIDALKLTWFRWVVEYDLEKQIGLLYDLFRGKSGGDAFGGRNLSIGDLWDLKHAVEDLPWGWIGGIFATVLSLPLILWWLARRKRKGGPAGPDGPETRAYRKMKRLLAARELVRRPSETQFEFARRVAAALPQAGDPVDLLTRAYLVAAFGQPSSPRPASEELEPAMEAVKRAVRPRAGRTV
jgi:hypothetical protein